MANIELKTKILLRNDVAANWLSVNPVLGKGEIGVEIDTNKLKIGDGVKNWSQLEYFGGEIKADGSSIELIDDTIVLKGVQSAGSGYTLVADGKGGVQWAKPSETTVEGLSGLITALDSRVGVAEGNIDTIESSIESINSNLEQKANKSELDSYLKADVIVQTYATKDEVNKKADSSVVNNIDTRVENIESGYIKSIEYTSGSGVFKIIKQDGSFNEVDLAIEKVVTNFKYNEDTKALDLTLADGSVQSVPMSAFIDDYQGKAGDEVIVSVNDSNEISAVLSETVKENINKGINALNQVGSLAELVNGHTTRLDNIDKSIVDINSKLNEHTTALQNIVKEVKTVDGVSLVDSDGIVTLPYATETALGLVKSNAVENGVSVDGSGKMSVHSLNVNKLQQTSGDELILNGGSASGTAA